MCEGGVYGRFSGNPWRGLYYPWLPRGWNWNYDTLWDLFQDIPAVWNYQEGICNLIEDPLINDNDPKLFQSAFGCINVSTLLARVDFWFLKQISAVGIDSFDGLQTQRNTRRYTQSRIISVMGFLKKPLLRSFFGSMFAFKNLPQSAWKPKLYLHRLLDSNLMRFGVICPSLVFS